MKHVFRLMTLMVFLFVFGSFRSDDSQIEKRKAIQKVILQGLNTTHYVIPKIDNDLSKRAFDLFIERLDYQKVFFLKSDIERFKAYEYKIDNEIENETFEFYDLVVSTVKERIQEARIYQEAALEKAFNFNKNEEIETDADKLDYAASKEELENRWRMSMKFQTMTRLVDKLELQEKAGKDQDTGIVVKSFDELEAAARKSVAKSHKSWFSRLEKLNETDHFSLYINSIVNAMDPHTSYFPPKQKEDFDIRMSGRLEGIGATLTEKDGYIKVDRIVPGSASWKQGDLKAGDLILKVGQADSEPVDVVGMRLDDAVKLIRGKKGTKVKLTVKKIDGSIMEIPIIRDVVIIEETYAKSAVVEDKVSGQRVGIIYLPQFYVDFTGSGGRSCSNDMHKEVEKLKAEGVDGIIMDLRGNGGGSLPDVVKIAGLFIEKGPIVQVKGRWGSPYVLEDVDPEVVYDGPLVVLVNSLSASASEIFAAAMQDYDRALIMGSNATFGKGTVQRFIELDNFLYLDDPGLKPLGSLKITMQKFYRINGQSTQLKGVVPDIILPDAFKYIDYGERELEYPLEWSTIEPVKYEKWEDRQLFTKSINESKNRVAHDSTFVLLDENAKRLKEQGDRSVFSLNLSKYRKVQNELKEENKKYKNIQKKIDRIDISNLKVDEEYIQSDSSRMARIEDWHKNLKKDRYVFEAVQVVEDL